MNMAAVYGKQRVGYGLRSTYLLPFFFAELGVAHILRDGRYRDVLRMMQSNRR